MSYECECPYPSPETEYHSSNHFDGGHMVQFCCICGLYIEDYFIPEPSWSILLMELAHCGILPES